MHEMIDVNPDKRPTIEECYRRFREMVDRLSPLQLSLPLKPRIYTGVSERPIDVSLPSSREEWDALDASGVAALWKSIAPYLDQDDMILFDPIDSETWRFLRGPVLPSRSPAITEVPITVGTILGNPPFGYRSNLSKAGARVCPGRNRHECRNKTSQTDEILHQIFIIDSIDRYQ